MVPAAAVSPLSRVRRARPARARAVPPGCPRRITEATNVCRREARAGSPHSASPSRSSSWTSWRRLLQARSSSTSSPPGLATGTSLSGSGSWQIGGPAPMALGMEAAGTVAAAGAGVAVLREGDDVMTSAAPGPAQLGRRPYCESPAGVIPQASDASLKAAGGARPLGLYRCGNASARDRRWSPRSALAGLFATSVSSLFPRRLRSGLTIM